MVMTGHAQRLAQPLAPRHKRAMAIIAVLAAVIAVWVALRPDHQDHSQNGCVVVLAASSTGTAELKKCGADARSWCATEYTQSDALAKLAKPQCHLAGIARRNSTP
jgi:hypothetical protein